MKGVCVLNDLSYAFGVGLWGEAEGMVRLLYWGGVLVGRVWEVLVGRVWEVLVGRV